MKVTQAVDSHLQYHRANSKKILSKPVPSFLKIQSKGGKEGKAFLLKIAGGTD
jgi:hypothetical protein